MATSEEVTQYVRASRATVSRALNALARVSIETRTRVQFIVRKSTGPVAKEVH
jgi:DNA-binding LacI/PurR family transcriptional regulator